MGNNYGWVVPSSFCALVHKKANSKSFIGVFHSLTFSAVFSPTWHLSLNPPRRDQLWTFKDQNNKYYCLWVSEWEGRKWEVEEKPYSDLWFLFLNSIRKMICTNISKWEEMKAWAQALTQGMASSHRLLVWAGTSLWRPPSGELDSSGPQGPGVRGTHVGQAVWVPTRWEHSVPGHGGPQGPPPLRNAWNPASHLPQ